MLTDHADGLGHITKDGPEICHQNFDPRQREWLSLFGIPNTTVAKFHRFFCTAFVAIQKRKELYQNSAL